MFYIILQDLYKHFFFFSSCIILTGHGGEKYYPNIYFYNISYILREFYNFKITLFFFFSKVQNLLKY